MPLCIRLAALKAGILLDRNDGKETDKLQQLSQVCWYMDLACHIIISVFLC